MVTRILRHLRRYRTDERGSISVEAVLMFPILLWAFAGMFVFWDAYKTENINLKATYTVADLISRAEDDLTQPFLDGVNDVYRYLIRSDAGNDLRVTIVRMALGSDGVTPEHQFVWSEATGTMIPHTNMDLLQNRLPMLSLGDQIIVVETQMNWEPPMAFGLEPMTMRELVFTSPRFVPQITFDPTA